MLETLSIFIVAAYVIGYLSTWRIGLAAFVLMVAARGAGSLIGLIAEYRREARGE